MNLAGRHRRDSKRMATAYRGNATAPVDTGAKPTAAASIAVFFCFYVANLTQLLRHSGCRLIAESAPLRLRRFLVRPIVCLGRHEAFEFEPPARAADGALLRS